MIVARRAAAVTRTTWAGSSLGAREAITVDGVGLYTAKLEPRSCHSGTELAAIETGKDADLIGAAGGSARLQSR